MTLSDGILILMGYVLGSIPFGYLFAKARAGVDIRTVGSGNIGATNVLRTQGKLLALFTLLLDLAKAAFPVWAGTTWGHAPWIGAAAGGAAVLGHCFPFTLRFRGGKGIASGLGAFLLIAPLPTLIALGVFLATLLLFRFVSLGSIAASLAFSAAVLSAHAVAGWYDPVTAVIGAAIGILLVTRHHRNIRNLLRKTEPRLWGKGKGGEA